MPKMKTGQKLESLQLEKVDVAPSTPAKMALLDKEVYAVYIGFDEVNKKSVVLTSEQAGMVRMQVNTWYYYLVAQFNTDMQGNITTPDIRVRYIRLTPKQYDGYVSYIQHMGDSPLIVAQKENNPTKDPKFLSTSYMPAKFSHEIPDAAKAKISQMRKDSRAIAALWNSLEIQMGMTFDQYQELLRANAQQASTQMASQVQMPYGAPMIQQTAYQAPQMAIPAPMPTTPVTDTWDEPQGWDDEPAPQPVAPKKAASKKPANKPAPKPEPVAEPDQFESDDPVPTQAEEVADDEWGDATTTGQADPFDDFDA